MELFLWIGIATVVFLCIEWFIRQIKISNFKNKHVLVTGCDTGFGNEVAKKLDQMGFKVFACCLTKVAVKEFNKSGSSNLKAIEMDVTKDASIEKAMEIVQRNLPDNRGLWAIVNNAGIVGGVGPTGWQSRQDYENVLAVNLYGVIMVTKAYMPLLIKEKGRVINTASILGRIAFSDPSYCISKYGVEAFSDVLRRENMARNIDVSVHIIEPGFYRTPLLLNEEMYKSRVDAKVKQLPSDLRKNIPSNVVELMTETFVTFTNKVASPNVNDVVDAYIDAIITKFPKKRYLVGFDANFIFRPLWMIPEWISDRIIVKMLGK